MIVKVEYSISHQRPAGEMVLMMLVPLLHSNGLFFTFMAYRKTAKKEK